MRPLLMIVVIWTQGYLFAPELMRLPALFGHFLEHRNEPGGMDLAEFLSLHYDHHTHDPQSPDEHDDLPFHHHHGAAIDPCCMKLVVSDVPRQVSFPEDVSDRACAIPPVEALLPGFTSRLLQPPRALA